MIIECPACSARYKIDPSKTDKSKVRIKCPRCAHLFLAELRREEGAPAAVELDPKKVLVVDDSRFFREMIVDMLQPLEVECLTAADADEALDLIHAKRPALVLLDLNLPGKSGYDLIREVRADVRVNGIRLLAMSGVYRKETDVAEVTRAGADAFINKSFKPEQLQQRVGSMLQGRA